MQHARIRTYYPYTCMYMQNNNDNRHNNGIIINGDYNIYNGNYNKCNKIDIIIRVIIVTRVYYTVPERLDRHFQTFRGIVGDCASGVSRESWKEKRMRPPRKGKGREKRHLFYTRLHSVSSFASRAHYPFAFEIK